ncbi:MAG: LuxR C-terminal-related transcriptional regulator [Chloroflexi bacterium]|nr:LuxR C-terminal-related transcriptional regulator [Chloroflexota bacterium]
MAAKNQRGRPSTPPERRPQNRGWPDRFRYSDVPDGSRLGQGYPPDPRESIRVLGETAVEYQPGLSFRLGPELSSRLRLAAFARRWAPEILAAQLLMRGLDQEPDRIRAESAVGILTPRERDVTHLTALGKTNHEIAFELGISGETVKSHIRSTLAKLALHSKSELRLLVQTLGSWKEGPEPER